MTRRPSGLSDGMSSTTPGSAAPGSGAVPPRPDVQDEDVPRAVRVVERLDRCLPEREVAHRRVDVHGVPTVGRGGEEGERPEVPTMGLDRRAGASRDDQAALPALLEVEERRPGGVGVTADARALGLEDGLEGPLRGIECHERVGEGRVEQRLHDAKHHALPEGPLRDDQSDRLAPDGPASRQFVDRGHHVAPRQERIELAALGAPARALQDDIEPDAPRPELDHESVGRPSRRAPLDEGVGPVARDHRPLAEACDPQARGRRGGGAVERRDGGPRDAVQHDHPVARAAGGEQNPAAGDHEGCGQNRSHGCHGAPPASRIPNRAG